MNKPSITTRIGLIGIVWSGTAIASDNQKGDMPYKVEQRSIEDSRNNSNQLIDIEIVSIVDALGVTSIKLNRGNCKVPDYVWTVPLNYGQYEPHQYMKTISLKFGESISILVDCGSILEVEVGTDQGTWTSTW